MVKVLNVIDGVGWCGTKEQTYLITRLLKEKGIESHIALAFEHEQMRERLRGFVELKPYEHHRGGISRFNPMNVKRLKSVIEQGGYDVVIAHSSHALDYLRMAYAFLKRKPKVIALRRSGYIPGLISKKLKYSVADRIVVVSKQVAQELKKADFFPERLRVIESGIDLRRFYPKPELYESVREKLKVSKDEYLIMNVANWQPWRKGQEVLLEALSKLSLRNFKMVFIGIGTDSEEARETFRRFGLEDRCIGLGFREDIDYLLQGADLFVLSSFSEGIAGALLQAMATGRLVVSTSAGGIPEYLKDSENGFLCPVGDSTTLAEKIGQALSLGENEKKKITENAVQTAKRYSIDRTVDEYVKLIKELTLKEPVLER